MDIDRNRLLDDIATFDDARYLRLLYRCTVEGERPAALSQPRPLRRPAVAGWMVPIERASHQIMTRRVWQG